MRREGRLGWQRGGYHRVLEEEFLIQVLSPDDEVLMR